MVIAVDIDNVLIDFIGSFVDYANAELGYDIDKKTIKSNVLWPYFNIDRMGHWDIFFKYYKTEYASKAAPIKDCREVLSKLSKDHRIIAITGRPETVKAETESWLHTYLGDVIDEVIYTNTNLDENDPDRRSKSECCFAHKADIIIDDDHFFANECAEAGIPTIYFKTPYNEKDKRHDDLFVAEDWKHVLSIINERKTRLHENQN